jgi:hypothetical protein
MTHTISRRQLLKYTTALSIGLALPWEVPAGQALASVQVSRRPSTQA